MNVDLNLIEKIMDLKAGQTFLDIGAALGSWTLPALSQGADVIAFEPHQVLAFCLIENAFLNSWETRLKLHPFAAWSTDNSLIPYILFFNSSFKKEDYNNNIKTRFPYIPLQPIYVRGATIDSLNLQSLDMVKIDVEGAEKEVIKGARQTLKKFAPKIIVENHVDICGELEIEGYKKEKLEDGKFMFSKRI